MIGVLPVQRATRRMLRSLLVGVVITLASPGVAAALGPYTLPFHDYTTVVTQGYWTGHRGIDYGLNYEPVVAARAGTVVDFREGYEDSGLCAPAEGNYVLIQHSGGQHTLYLHLKKNSVIPTTGATISAGQTIATSGNSGYSCGPHLHYGLFVNNDWRDPNDALDPAGDWTTADPGKVPFLAAYAGEHSPSGYTVYQYTTWTTWVQFRNDGGRTWSWSNDSYGRGRIFLGAVTSYGGTSRVSAFYKAGDWESNSRPGQADTNNVAPGQTVRFTFQLYASPSGGTFNEYFNLGAHQLAYFNYSYLSGFYIPITVNHCC